MARKKKIEITNGLEQVNNIAIGSAPKKTLVQEIEEMRASGQVGTPEFVTKMRELEVLLGVSEISPFGTNELGSNFLRVNLVGVFINKSSFNNLDSTNL